jgi:uncharacterized protein with beta-barrel porin domain
MVYLRSIGAVGAVLLYCLIASAHAATITATDETTLRNAILASNDTPGGTIVLSGNITLTQSLPMITGNVSIVGNGHTIDANNTGRVFFVQAGTVAISNVAVANALAQGGAGSSGGGGGLGAGAALFVNTGANVTASNLMIKNSAAVGGAGSSATTIGGGGGGGLGGVGGSPGTGPTGLAAIGGGGGYQGPGGNGGGGAGSGGGGGGEFGAGGQITTPFTGGIVVVSPFAGAGGGGGGGLLGTGGTTNGQGGAGGGGKSGTGGFATAGGGSGGGGATASAPANIGNSAGTGGGPESGSGGSVTGSVGTNGGNATAGGGGGGGGGGDIGPINSVSFTPGNGGNGGFGGGGGGVGAGTVAANGGNGGFGGGGGGGSNGSGAGGIGGVGGGGGGGPTQGGKGGDFGGGGGSNVTGGAGGFGGGGGSGAAAGNTGGGGAGGFGGGGGAGGGLGTGSAGAAGMFAGAGASGLDPLSGGSGGGAALGGAVFVRAGGTLTIADVGLSGGFSATGGAGGAGGHIANSSTSTDPGGNGQAMGSVLFLDGFSGAANTTTLSVGAGNSLTISPVDAIAGNGALAKAGAGSLILNAANNNFSGTTTVGEGTLVVGDASHAGATLGGQVNVTGGGTLAGHGSVGGAVTNSGGTVNPGGSIGALTVGSFTQGANGTLSTEVGPKAGSELIALGSAVLGGTLKIVLDPGLYAPQTYVLLHSAGLSGTFNTEGTTAAAPGASINLTSTDVDLVLAQPFAVFAGIHSATNPNQSAAQSALNGAKPTAGDLADVLLTLPTLSLSQQRSALTQISGVAFTGTTALTVAQGQALNNLILGRLLPLGAGGTDQSAARAAQPVQLAFGGTATDVRADASQLAAAGYPSTGAYPRNGLWLEGAGEWGRIAGDANAPGASSEGGEVMAGYDRSLGEFARIGAALGYGHARDTESDGGGSGTLDSYRLAAYAGYQRGHAVLGGAIGYTFDQFKQSRAVSALGHTATSAHSGNEFNASAEIGYRIQASALTVMPFVSLDYEYLRQSGFAESGGGALDLTVGSSQFQSLQPEAGLYVSRRFALGSAIRMMLEAHAGVRRELLDTTANTSAQLTAALSGAFTAQGVAVDRTIGDFGAKLTAHLPSAIDLFAGYDARISGNQTNQTVGLGLLYKF